MGWLRRSAAALFISAAALVGYNTTGTTQETTPTVVEEITYRKPQPVPATSDDTKYRLANAAAYVLATTLSAVGLGYVAKQDRRKIHRHDQDHQVLHQEMLLIGPLYYRYRDFSDEGKAIVDAQLEEARKKEEAARIKAEQVRETAKKMTAHTNILGGEEEVRRLKEKTKITRVYDKDRTGLQFNAPEYKTVVSPLVDSSVRHDFVANAQTKEYTLRRFDISSNELDRIAEPYAMGLLKIEQAKEEVKKAKTRAEQIAEEMRAAVVKLV